MSDYWSGKTVAVTGGCGMIGSHLVDELAARGDLTVVSIDVQPCPEELENIIRAGYGSSGRYIRILGRSQDVARAWRFGYVDLLFVDGGHSYADCYGDLALWYPHVRPGGIIAVHDYEAAMLPAIRPAVDEFVAQQGGALQYVDRAGTLIAYRVRE